MKKTRVTRTSRGVKRSRAMRKLHRGSKRSTLEKNNRSTQEKNETTLKSNKMKERNAKQGGDRNKRTERTDIIIHRED